MDGVGVFMADKQRELYNKRFLQMILINLNLAETKSLLPICNNAFHQLAVVEGPLPLKIKCLRILLRTRFLGLIKETL
jgi:hypothetical protein